MLAFFLARLFFLLDEITSTALALAAIVLTCLLWYNKHEATLFFIGVAVGAFIEIGLGSVQTEQFWEQASLFGVPYWLPLAWGLGFVTITRLGSVVRALDKQKR